MSIDNCQKSAVLVDLCAWDGHHRTYFLKVTRALQELGFTVYALCLGADDWQRESQSDSSKVLQLMPPSKLLKMFISGYNRIVHRLTGELGVISEYSVCNLWAVRNAMRLGNVPSDSIVFFLHLDSILVAKPILLGKFLMPKRWTGIYFLPAFRTPQSNSEYRMRRSREEVFGCSSCMGIYLLDEGAIEDVRRSAPQGLVEYLPEPIDLSSDHNLALPTPFARSKENNRSIVGMFGNLDKRKNVLNLVRAAAGLESSGIDLILKGKLDLTGYTATEKEEFLNTVRHSGNISAEFIDETLLESEFNRLIAASDIVFLAYRDFVGSSNILVKAASYKRPVVASRGYVIGERVDQYGLGMTVDQDDVPGIRIALNSLAKNYQADSELRDAFLDRNDPRLLVQQLSLIVDAR